MGIETRPGTIVDERYELVRQLGVGGMGTVFLAREIGLERLVAVKLLQQELLSDTDSAARFERESQVLAAVQHENIVSLYRYGIWRNKCPYIVMEYLEGQSLRKKINDNSLSIDDKISVAVQLCSALQAAHASGITHRDLKPDNVMVVQDSPCRIKVLDFGLCAFDGSKVQHLTRTGALIGSVHYMSPEQCLGKRADNRSDIYSLGCIIYELVSGNPPFECDNPIGLIHKQAHEQPALFPAALNAPVGLEVLVFKALQKDPDLRHQTMSEFGKDLRLIQEGHGDTLGTLKPKSQNRVSRGNMLLVGSCVVGVIACGTSLYQKMKPAAPPLSDRPHRSSLKPKALKSQWSLRQSYSAAERKKAVLNLVNQFEHHDDLSLTPLELVSVYDALRECSAVPAKELAQHFDRLIAVERLKTDRSAVALAYTVRGRFLITSGMTTEAERSLKTAIAMAEKVSANDILVESALALSKLYTTLKKPKEAKELALLCCTKYHPLEPSERAGALITLVTAESALGEYSDARKTSAELLKHLDPGTQGDQILNLCTGLQEFSAPFALEQTNFFLESYDKTPKAEALTRRLTFVKALHQKRIGAEAAALDTLNSLWPKLAPLTSHDIEVFKSSFLRERAYSFIEAGRYGQAKSDLQNALSIAESNSTLNGLRRDCLLCLVKIAAIEHKPAEMQHYLHELDKFEENARSNDEVVFRHYSATADDLDSRSLPLASAMVMQHLTNGNSSRSNWLGDAARIMTAVYLSKENRCPIELEKARPALARMDKIDVPIAAEVQQAVYGHYANMLLRLGKPHDAAAVHKIALRHLSTDTVRANGIRLSLASIYRYSIKNYEVAQRLLNEVLQTATGLLRLQATQELGNILVDDGKPNEALKIFATIKVPPEAEAQAQGDGFMTVYYQVTLGQARACKAKNDLAQYRLCLKKAEPMAQFLHLKVPDF
ncbi:MAG: serine/threonine protein kinase [Candidatus Obscuribacterales bacterium]|nr:serine/threonine protein kinase [Candidatus Obscuribacterales bacterium]